LVHLQPATARSVRRLAKRLAPETIQGLALVITADSFGRPPRPRVPPEGLRSLLQVAEALELEAAAPKPILKGRHLLPLGLSAGPDLGRLLDAAFEAQLDGAFSDLPGALAWVAEQSAIELGADVRERARKGAMPPAPE
jgi:tRNA nucleotidyltransferase (CCA-adding enzyme)